MKNPERIRTIAQLRAVANARQSVISPMIPKPRPAAWVLNMPASWLNDRLLEGTMRVYTPKTPRRITRAEHDLEIALEALEYIAGEKRPWPLGYTRFVEPELEMARETLALLRPKKGAAR